MRRPCLLLFPLSGREEARAECCGGEIPCSRAHLNRLRLEVRHCHGGALRLSSRHSRRHWTLVLRLVRDEPARRFGWWVLRPPGVSKWHCGCGAEGSEASDMGLPTESAGEGALTREYGIF